MRRPAYKKVFPVAAAGWVLLLTAACGGSGDPADPAPTTSAPTTAPTATMSDDGVSTTGNYRDGDYEAEANYVNPAGSSEVTVDLTLQAGTITAIEVTPGAENLTSRAYQKKFVGGIADKVVGKSIDEIKVSKVSGSSLTSRGFNKAIDEIKADASA